MLKASGNEVIRLPLRLLWNVENCGSTIQHGVYSSTSFESLPQDTQKSIRHLEPEHKSTTCMHLIYKQS